MQAMRVMFVCPIYNVARTTGAGQRSQLLLRALAALGDVDVVLISEEACADLEGEITAIHAEIPCAKSVHILRSTRLFVAPPSQPGYLAKAVYVARRVQSAFVQRRMLYRPTADARRRMTDLVAVREPHVIVGRYLQPTAISGALDQSPVPVIVDLDDMEEGAIRSRLHAVTTARLERLLLRSRLRQMERFLPGLRRSCRHVFTASEPDLGVVDHPSVSLLPNIPFEPPDPHQPLEDPDLGAVLFMGTFQHRANRDGLHHFLATAWPQVRLKRPDSRLRIVGSGGWESMRHVLESVDGVTVVGKVADVASEYRAASIAVAPLFEGGGTKIKVLEALAYGRAVVATPHSARGLEALVGNGMVVAQDDANFVQACIDLLADAGRRREVAERGRMLVAQRFSQIALDGIVARAVASVVPAVLDPSDNSPPATEPN